MKRTALTLVLAVSAVLCTYAQSDTLRILAIGNSFSQDAVEQYLHEIAAADGRTYIIGNMYIGGCALSRHYGNARSDSPAYEYRKVGVDGIRRNTKAVSLAQALADEKWDVVSLQQVSGHSGHPESFEPYLEEMVAYVRARVPENVRLCWHQTWSYDKMAVHGDFPSYDSDCDRMYEAIVNASKGACDKYGFTVIPSGTAVQNCRTCLGFMTRDGFHLNLGVGRFTAALTWYETLSGRSVLDNGYKPETVSEEFASMARKAAHEAVRKPYEVTELGFDVPAAIYDEALVPEYTLPDALTMADGRKVRSVKMWENERRPELLELFTTEEYGRAPGRPEDLSFELVESGDAFDGLAVRKQVKVRYGSRANDYFLLLLYAPKDAEGPVPAFLGINFCGNAAVSDDPAILRTDLGKLNSFGVYQVSGRGAQKSRWCVEDVVKAGYAVATFDRSDVDPDFDDGFVNGVQSMYLKNGQIPAPDEWGAIAGWAWGLSRALDYLETEPLVDAAKVAVIGHSRLGKAALWAGAVDQRFAMVISNCSGCGGAALSRRAFGETVSRINHSFPHWFCDNFWKYNGNEADLPFDQHELIALIAPRPVYVASASEDLWADPAGEKLAADEAAKVYRLWGRKAVQKIGHHVRPGGHDIQIYDWERYFAFADRWLK